MHICYKSITVFLISVLLFAGCTEPKYDGKITIACTTGIVADCIRNIVSDEVKVIALMGAGVDPHLYKASQGDIAKLSTADIIVYLSLIHI